MPPFLPFLNFPGAETALGKLVQQQFLEQAQQGGSPASGTPASALVPRPQPEQPTGGGGRGAIDQLLAGPVDPRLSPEENELARRRALVAGGAAGLLATGQMERGGILSTLGAIIASGQAASIDEARHILSTRPDPVQRKTQVITRPDGTMDLIDSLTGEVITNLGPPEPDEKAEPKAVQTQDGRQVFASWDDKIGAYRGLDGEILVNAFPVQEDVRGVQMDVMSADGRTFTILVDPTDNSQIGEARLKALPGDEDAGDAALTAEMRLRFDNLARLAQPAITGGEVPFGVFEEAIERRGLPLPDVVGEALRSRFTSPEIQAFSADADAFVQIMVKAREGGRPSDKDREFILNFVKPRASDSPATWVLKLQRMNQILQFAETTGMGKAFDFATTMAGGTSSSVFGSDPFGDLEPGGGRP
jgi:hypothetical protein